MNPQQAHQALHGIHVAEEQALRAAFPRLPWWSVAGTAAILLSMGVTGDINPSGTGPLPSIIAFAWIGLDWVTERWIGVQVHPSRRTRRTFVLKASMVAALLAVFLLSVTVLASVNAPLPGTITGGIMALTSVLLRQPIQRAMYASLRRNP
jgi:hypothetical protein